MTTTLEKPDEIEKRLMVVSTALEVATISLETLVTQMREALASAKVANEALADAKNKPEGETP